MQRPKRRALLQEAFCKRNGTAEVCSLVASHQTFPTRRRSMVMTARLLATALLAVATRPACSLAPSRARCLPASRLSVPRMEVAVDTAVEPDDPIAVAAEPDVLIETTAEEDDLIAAFFNKERNSAVIAEAEATSIPTGIPMDVAPAGTSPYLDTADHRAGFVSIVGKPNVGKSTLMNAILGTRLSIITSKAQTTRHRIMGISNGDDYQIV